MKKQIIILAFLLLATAMQAAKNFVSFTKGAGMTKLTGSSDTIVYDRNEWKGVVMAVNNLRNDLKAVTGSPCARITVATVGKSPIAKQYEKYAKMLKGKWEQYIIVVRGEKGEILILGSDKRGTIYGIYELSRQLGVSPWYWMADAPIEKHDEVWVKPGVYTDGEPKVKYRGIFINDEWPSFGTWCNNQFGGVNSKGSSAI